MKKRLIKLVSIAIIVCFLQAYIAYPANIFYPVLGDIMVEEPAPSTGTTTANGFFITNDSSLTINNATVFINVNAFNSTNDIFEYHFEMMANFTIKKQNAEKNVTICFVYPAVWEDGANISKNELPYDIYINNTKVQNYITEQGSKISSYIYNNVTSYEYLLNILKTSKVVLFNTTLHENSTTNISINTRFSVTTDAEKYYFDYVIAASKTWSGEFTEIINITITHPEYIRVLPAPQFSLTESKYSWGTNVLWRINSSNVDNFSPVVGIEFIHPTYHPRESSSGEHYLPDPIAEVIHVILFFLIYIPLMFPFMGIVEFVILFIVLHMLVKKMQQSQKKQEEKNVNEAFKQNK